jgi:hypothetical protein
MRLRIEYSDQNESFAAQLPREGVVVAQPRSSDSDLSWYLLSLDAPVTYEHAAYTHVLLASRWYGHRLGGAEPTPVFILLVPRRMPRLRTVSLASNIPMWPGACPVSLVPNPSMERTSSGKLRLPAAAAHVQR